ncbi:MAG: hypothetical protein Fur0042_23520 [Cyanophyceae cyanobacterium]
MTRAGNALKIVLETHSISRNRLAIAMGVDRSNVSHWVSGERDPVADAVYGIHQALHQLNPEAAALFVRLYLHGEDGGEDNSDGDYRNR